MAMTLITNSADTDSTDLASISFTSSIDSTYKLYIFKYFDINPATDAQFFSFQVNATDSTGYDRNMTTTSFQAYHTEADDGTTLGYNAGHDQDNDDQAFQILAGEIGNGADESAAGTLWLFNPSNTTYVKHFYARVVINASTDYSSDMYTAGYLNTTTAIDDIQFKMSSGNMDSVIKMYGVG